MIWDEISVEGSAGLRRQRTELSGLMNNRDDKMGALNDLATRTRPGRGAVCPCSPASPFALYACSHPVSAVGLTPVSSHTRSRLNPSCRCSLTAFSFSSKRYLRRFPPVRGSRTCFLSTVSFVSTVTLLFALECHPIIPVFRVYDLVVSTEVDASPDDDPVSETRALAYRGRLSGDRGNLVSFYLINDASTTYAWEFNNDQFKPAAAYGYTRGAGVFMGTQLGLWKRIGSFEVGLNDPFEAMSLASRSWSKLVGAENRTAGSIQDNLDLSLESFSVPGGTGGFGDEHSAEFNRNIQVLKPFYDALLRRLKMEPTR